MSFMDRIKNPPAPRYSIDARQFAMPTSDPGTLVVPQLDQWQMVVFTTGGGGAGVTFIGRGASNLLNSGFRIASGVSSVQVIVPPGNDLYARADAAQNLGVFLTTMPPDLFQFPAALIGWLRRNPG